MSRRQTINFQPSKMSKWHAKHISTKVSFKITIRKRHAYIDISWPWNENSVSFWRFEMTIVQNDSFAFIWAHYTINSQITNETEFTYKIWHINLFMNIGISNWHNWIFDLTYMLLLILFQFLTRYLTSKHLKLFSTYLVVRNGTMWKTCFPNPQNAKKENQLKHKNQLRNRLFIDS